MTTVVNPASEPDDVNQKVHHALVRLVEGLEKKDPIYQAVEKHSKLVGQALRQGATLTDILCHFQAEGLTCGRDRLRAILQRLNLWKPRPKKPTKGAEPAPQ